ncbi:MAG: flagellar capping [Desulfobulbaceae bacterium]|nr:MAG: flagellar capping [Desulfobulbaceae bacterium]
MSITFSGLATGLDTDKILTQLMEIERNPITRLETKKKNETARLEAYAQFKTTLDGLKTAVSDMTLTSQVRSNTVSVSGSAPFTATSANANSGSYNVSVKQLAQVQKTSSAGYTSQTDALLGNGTFTLSKGGTDTVITVDSTNNSLLGLAAAINEQSATTGIKAAIINDGSATPYRLALTGVDSGTTFTTTNTLAPTAMVTTTTQAAQQAEAYIDGIKVVSNSNTISGAISGVTLNLNGVSEAAVVPVTVPPTPPYKTSLLEIKSDTGALKEKLTNFVSSYNKTMDWILSGYAEFGGATVPDDDPDTVDLLGSVLRGDSSISSVKRGLQSALSSVINTSGSMKLLSELGITTQLNGTLSQNNVKMDAALADNFEGVVKLLAGEDSTDGVMKKFNSYLLTVTSGTTGLYATKKANYSLSAKRIDDQILNMEPRMVKKEARLRAQYTAMENIVSGLNAQGSFLTQQMDMLSNMLKG